jgi:signal transduction histidine kinase
MAAVGQLAGGIAHDFNNIPTAIMSYSSLLKMKMKKDDPLSSHICNILALSESASSLAQSLLATGLLAKVREFLDKDASN